MFLYCNCISTIAFKDNIWLFSEKLVDIINNCHIGEFSQHCLTDLLSACVPPPPSQDLFGLSWPKLQTGLE